MNPIDNDDVDVDSLEGFSPEMIAATIFKKEPKEPCSYQILAYQEGTDMTYIYEILITILLEGLEIFTGGLKEVDLSDFSTQHITVMNPWFKSIGFEIHVDSEDYKDKDEYKEYYCRAVINNKANETLFIMKGIEGKTYHFLLNGTYLEENKKKYYLNEIYGIFQSGDTVYKISFDFYLQPPEVAPNKLL